MTEKRVFNFSAGPSTLPVPVLEKAAKQMLNYENSGMSVMEMSHRSSSYLDIFQKTKDLLKKVMNVPDDYKIVFIQGGATQQFSMVPLNLLKNGKADYIITGSFSKKAANEAKKYGSPSNLITDRWPAYNEAIATLLPQTNHLPVKPMSSDINNNIIESFNKTFKA